MLRLEALSREEGAAAQGECGQGLGLRVTSPNTKLWGLSHHQEVGPFPTAHGPPFLEG